MRVATLAAVLAVAIAVAYGLCAPARAGHGDPAQRAACSISGTRCRAPCSRSACCCRSGARRQRARPRWTRDAPAQHPGLLSHRHDRRAASTRTSSATSPSRGTASSPASRASRRRWTPPRAAWASAAWGTLRRVHVPLLARSGAAALLLVFVDVMKELPGHAGAAAVQLRHAGDADVSVRKGRAPCRSRAAFARDRRGGTRCRSSCWRGWPRAARGLRHASRRASKPCRSSRALPPAGAIRDLLRLGGVTCRSSRSAADRS